MSTAALAPRRPTPLVLGDVLAGSRVRDALLVAGGAALTILGAQISIHVPGSPVPVTGQTLGVVIAGAALGARRGAASQLPVPACSACSSPCTRTARAAST